MARAPLAFGDLEPALEAGRTDEVVALLAGRSEEERRAVAPEVRRWCTGGLKGREASEAFIARRKVATPAVLGCASLPELKRLPVRWFHHSEASAQVLIDRRPSWAAAWVDLLLEQEWRPWPFCRRLVLAGVCPTPATDGYTLGLVCYERHQQGTVMSLLRKDPALLDDEVWRLFTVEGRPRDGNLTGYGRGWTTTLLELAADGTLSRDRLVDATLDALAGDQSPHNARWFQELHGRLETTLDERVARLDRYLHLVGSQVPKTVALALEVLDGIEVAGRLVPADLADALEPAVAGGPKATAMAALRLAERAGGRERSGRPAAMATASAALGHPSVDVQAAALGLLGRILEPGDIEARASLLGRGDAVAPSLRSQLDELVGVQIPSVSGPAAAAAAEGDQPGIEVELRRRIDRLGEASRRLAGIDEALGAIERRTLAPPLSFARHEVPALSASTALAPLVDVADLVDLLSTLVESCDSGDEAERALDGVSRLCGEDLSGLPTTALVKRARSLVRNPPATGITRPGFGGPRGEVCGLVLAWLDGDVRGGPAGSGPGWFLAQRASEVAERARRRQPAPLLGAPTHRGGWLDPAALVARLRQLAAAGQEPTTADAYQALLRLGPCPDPLVVEELRRLSGPVVEAVRFALGDPEAEVAEGSPLRPAAHRRRSWAAVDLQAEDFPGASQPQPYDASHLHPDLAAALGVSYVLSAMESAATSAWKSSRPAIRWVATLSPLATESFFRIGAGAWRGTWPGQEAYLEPLLDPDVPCTPAGARLLAAAASAKEPQVASLATDLLIALGGDGRLDPVQHSGLLSSQLAAGEANAARLASGLAEVARSSTLHGVLAATILEGLFEGDAGHPPHQLHHLLQLHLQLSTDLGLGVSSPAARSYLAGLKAGSPSSKQGRLAGQLLDLPDRGAAARRTAGLEALRGRVERAERWDAALAR